MFLLFKLVFNVLKIVLMCLTACNIVYSF